MRHNNDKGMWVLHKPEACRNRSRSSKLDDKVEQKEDRNKSNNDQAMPATEERDDDSCSSSSSEESG